MECVCFQLPDGRINPCAAHVVFARVERAAEREACAKIADAWAVEATYAAEGINTYGVETPTGIMVNGEPAKIDNAKLKTDMLMTQGTREASAIMIAARIRARSDFV
jgi:histidine ammonia-lyase